MNMSRILELLERREESETPKDGRDRALVRVFDAFERAEKKAEGSGPDAALKAIAQRIDKTDDFFKLSGISDMIGEIISKGGTTGIRISGATTPKWTLSKTNEKFLQMLKQRVDGKI
jgi:hypothetical protein